MLLYCNHGHLKSKANTIAHNRCKLCRFIAQKRSRQRFLFERQFVLNIIKSIPCSDCGVKYPSFVMDFHHIKGRKYKAISKMLDSNSWEKIKKEIDKCEVLCSNCHRVKTFKSVNVNPTP